MDIQSFSKHLLDSPIMETNVVPPPIPTAPPVPTAPAPPAMMPNKQIVQKNKSCDPAVREKKRALREADRKMDALHRPFGLAAANPEFVSKHQFDTYLRAAFGGFHFSKDDVASFRDCRKKFYDWKSSYLDYCTTMKALNPQNGVSVEEKMTAIAAFNITKFQVLTEKIEEEFTEFVIAMMEFVTKTKITTFDQAKEVFKAEKGNHVANEVTDELGKFGGIHGCYKTLLINACKKEGIEWLNRLIEASGVQKEGNFKIEDLAKWLAGVAENVSTAPDAAKSALDRIGYTKPDETLLNFFEKQFPNKEELEYPIPDHHFMTKEMENHWKILNTEKNLIIWRIEVHMKRFSPKTGWKNTDNIYSLKEAAILIAVRDDLNVSKEFTKELKSLARGIIGYYFTNELMPKYQAS